MLVQTVQKSTYLNEILKGSYMPIFSKSLGNMDEVTKKAYESMISELLKKDPKKLPNDRSCYWGWVKNPVWVNHAFNSISNNLVLIEVDIPEDKLLLSDFDKWNDKFINGSDINPFIEVKDIKESDRVQAVFWDIPLSSIKKISSFNTKKESLEDF